MRVSRHSSSERRTGGGELGAQLTGGDEVDAGSTGDGDLGEQLRTGITAREKIKIWLGYVLVENATSLKRNCALTALAKKLTCLIKEDGKRAAPSNNDKI